MAFNRAAASKGISTWQRAVRHARYSTTQTSFYPSCCKTFWRAGALSWLNDSKHFDTRAHRRENISCNMNIVGQSASWRSVVVARAANASVIINITMYRCSFHFVSFIYTTRMKWISLAECSTRISLYLIPLLSNYWDMRRATRQMKSV